MKALLRKAAGAAALVLIVASCATPEISTKGIRPGVGSDFNLDVARPPVGAVFTYQMTATGIPMDGVASLRVGQLGDSYTHDGTITFEAGPRYASRLFSFLRMEYPDMPITRDGDNVSVGVSALTDNRYRGMSVSIMSDTTTYSPHDCFATIGTCRYVRTSGEDGSRALIVQTTESGGVWRSSTWVDTNDGVLPSRTPLEQDVFSIDRNGILIDSRNVEFIDGQGSRFEVRRIE